MSNKLKKYKLNFNAGCFNYGTRKYGNNTVTYLTREEALRNKWKCENALKSSEVTECYTNIRFKFIHIKINLFCLNMSLYNSPK